MLILVGLLSGCVDASHDPALNGLSATLGSSILASVQVTVMETGRPDVTSDHSYPWVLTPLTQHPDAVPCDDSVRSDGIGGGVWIVTMLPKLPELGVSQPVVFDGGVGTRDVDGVGFGLQEGGLLTLVERSADDTHVVIELEGEWCPSESDNPDDCTEGLRTVVLDAHTEDMPHALVVNDLTEGAGGVGNSESTLCYGAYTTPDTSD